MRRARVCTAVLSAAAITALSVTSAGAATPASGVGAAQGTSTVFSLALGTAGGAASAASPSLLSTQLIGDLGSVSNDPAAGPTSALTRLAGLQSASSAVPALNLNVPSSPVQAQSPGGAPSVSTPAVTLSNLAGVGVPASVASGTLEPATLAAVVDSTGAHSNLSAGVSGIALAGGLVGLGSAATKVSDDAGGSQASSVRSLQTGPITVLSLGQLLAGLGIPLSDLPLSTLSNLLGTLHLPLPSVPGAVSSLPTGSNLSGEVAALAAAVNSITTELKVPASSLVTRPQPMRSHLGLPSLPVSVSSAGNPIPSLPPLPTPTGLPVGANTGGITSGSAGQVTSAAVNTLSSELSPVLDALGLGQINLATALSTVTNLTSLLDTLQADLGSVLDQALSALDSAALLKVSGLDIALSTIATSSVATSLAQLQGTVGSVSVGNLLTTPSLNLTTAASTLSGVVAGLQSAVGSVLGQVSSSLSGVVSVKVLTPLAGSGISQDGKYIKALDGITALTATITPPANLASLVSSLTSAVNLPESAAGLLGLAGVPAATVASLGAALAPIATLSATLSQTLGALANGAVLRVGSLQAQSDFAPAPVAGASPATPGTPGTTSPPGHTVPTPGKLPFTGGNSALGAFGGAGLLAVVAGRRLRLARRARRS
ncbi:MAG TPA: hypothetical protein VMU63_07045 [Acidimicrobiales bacterium]|nr:hypothetical protein [Acidimicrobiales bacterium]